MRWIIAVFLLVASMAHGQRATEAAAASLRILDRTTGQLEDVLVPRGQAVKMGHLTVTMHQCRYPRRAINSDAYAYLTVNDDQIGEQIFSGWMVASSPGLNALEHARYDVWVLRCRT